MLCRGCALSAPDRPGQGLSDPIDLPVDVRRYREAAVDWLDRVLDAAGLDTPALLGHSGGAMWALWYALDRPQRVDRLVVVGPPGVPGTQAAPILRVGATPGLGALTSRLVSPSPKSVLQFAHHAAGERESLRRYPDLVGLFVATLTDPVNQRVGRDEYRVFI